MCEHTSYRTDAKEDIKPGEVQEEGGTNIRFRRAPRINTGV